MNGRIWINSGKSIHTILIVNCILNSENMNNPEYESKNMKIIQKELWLRLESLANDPKFCLYDFKLYRFA